MISYRIVNQKKTHKQKTCTQYSNNPACPLNLAKNFITLRVCLLFSDEMSLQKSKQHRKNSHAVGIPNSRTKLQHSLDGYIWIL